MFNKSMHAQNEMYIRFAKGEVKLCVVNVLVMYVCNKSMYSENKI